MHVEWIRLMIAAARLSMGRDPAKSQAVRSEIWLVSGTLNLQKKASTGNALL